MTITEIPREEWANFFYGFNQRHKGWLVNTEIVGDEVRGQIQARQLPFEGITPELGDGADEIEIVVGERPDQHLSTHSEVSDAHRPSLNGRRRG